LTPPNINRYDAIFLAQHFMYKKTPAAAQAGVIVGALAQPQPATAGAREQPVLAFAAIDRRQGGRGGLKQRL
jgi:hypothetical protein